MIKTAEEFKQLRSSQNLDEQQRSSVEEASMKTWKEVITKYPDLKEWVIYNKTIPLEILKQLSTDPDPNVRSEVARKRKIDIEIFNRLKNDEDENVKLSLFYNTKLTNEQKNQININGSIWFQRQIFIKRKFAENKEKEIQLFGYNTYWKKLGIVNEHQIEEDIKEFKKGDDPDPDHFRHRRLTKWLKNKSTAVEHEYNLICELYQNDIDPSYANSVIVGFHNLKFLDEENQATLETKIENLSPYLKSFVEKERVKRKIRTNRLTMVEAEKIKKSEDNSILRYLVDTTNNLELLEKLTDYTGSKKIRNIAREKLKKAGNIKRAIPNENHSDIGRC